jgi:membrane-bound serine protease (ClpP class)
LVASLSVCAAQTASASGTSKVIQLNLTGTVDPFTSDYVTHGITSANDENASAVLLVIDTPGGLSSSMREIVSSILASKVPVICFVYPSGARAASAGTYIMMGCPLSAMAPGTEIGAAHPVGVSGAIEMQKVTNDAVAYIQSLAQMHGRNATWAAQSVTDSVSISAEEALQQNVIDLVEPSIPALLDTANGRQVLAANQETPIDTSNYTIETLNMSPGAEILHTLLSPDFAFLFFWLGLILIVVELLHPGLSLPGVLGALMLIGSLVAFGMLPVTLLGMALLIASVVLLLIELKHPGLHAPLIAGLVCLVLGGTLLFEPSARVSWWVIALVTAMVGLFFAFVVVAIMKARNLPPPADLGGVIGSTGVVVQALAPKGVVRVGAEEWSAISKSGRVGKGAKVRVLGSANLILDVEPVTDQKGSETDERPDPAATSTTEGSDA